jgi:hypothetical protein
LRSFSQLRDSTGIERAEAKEAKEAEEAEENCPLEKLRHPQPLALKVILVFRREALSG